VQISAPLSVTSFYSYKNHECCYSVRDFEVCTCQTCCWRAMMPPLSLTDGSVDAHHAECGRCDALQGCSLLESCSLLHALNGLEVLSRHMHRYRTDSDTWQSSVLHWLQLVHFEGTGACDSLVLVQWRVVQ